MNFNNINPTSKEWCLAVNRSDIIESDKYSKNNTQNKIEQENTQNSGNSIEEKQLVYKLSLGLGEPQIINESEMPETNYLLAYWLTDDIYSVIFKIGDIKYSKFSVEISDELLNALGGEIYLTCFGLYDFLYFISNDEQLFELLQAIKKERKITACLNDEKIPYNLLIMTHLPEDDCVKIVFELETKDLKTFYVKYPEHINSVINRGSWYNDLLIFEYSRTASKRLCYDNGKIQMPPFLANGDEFRMCFDLCSGSRVYSKRYAVVDDKIELIE